jgi:thiol-disulfide isomerase/thioredoxin
VVLVAGTVIGVLLAFSSDSKKDAVAPPGTLDVSAVAPNFTLPRVNGSGSVSLASYRGRPLILTFGASYCGPCHEEFPLLAKASKQHPEVAVVGVDPEDLPNQMRSMLRSTGATWPTGDDAKGNVAAQYGVTNLPVTFFIAPNGKIVARGFGLTSQKLVDAPLKTLLDTRV